jgi:hypothetical protein
MLPLPLVAPVPKTTLAGPKLLPPAAAGVGAAAALKATPGSSGETVSTVGGGDEFSDRLAGQISRAALLRR